jgi:hypothetical protein
MSGETLKRMTMNEKARINNIDLMARLTQMKSWNAMLYNTNVSAPATSSVTPFLQENGCKP